MRVSGQILAPNSLLLWNPACFTSNPGRHLHHQRNALRFFSQSRSTWRKKQKKPPSSRGEAQTRFHIRRGGSNVDETEVTKKLKPEDPFDRVVIDRLNVLADKALGTEFSVLAREIASQLRKSNIKRGHEFYHFVDSLSRDSIKGDPIELDTHIKYALHGHLDNKKIRQVSAEDHAALADLRYPLEWYPGTRRLQRTIHLHVGPTNSGKTYHALKRLEQAKTGLYAGPLRLLAYEVYTRLNAQGKKCHLITGDDRRINEDASDDTQSMISCTVEMVPVHTTVDVGVIDEIQMIGDPERAWAWSQAFLGLKAKELHVCGEARTAPLIQELAAVMGDKLVLHQYERLSPLKLAATSLEGDLERLRKGDCLVVFSKKEIHFMKNSIEKMTRKRVAIVYGSLPPETRARQASLFNDPDNDYDYLVATDAIGMGLNLDIKRIVFESTSKFNGTTHIRVPISHLKQIAGRAGRYRIASPKKLSSDSVQSMGNTSGDGLLSNSTSVSSARPSSTTVGLVTTLEKMDFPHLKHAMNTEAGPLMAAGIFPPDSVLVKFAAYFSPDTPFSYILQRLHDISSLHPRFFLCDLDNKLFIADVIEPVKNLTIKDRIVFCAAPVSNRDTGFRPIVVSLAQCVAHSKEVSSNILDIPAIGLEILDEELTMEREYLVKLELLHKALILYIWLSYRFTGVFTTRPMAVYLKEIVEEKIDKVLAQTKIDRKAKLKSRQQLAMLEELGQAMATGEDVQKVNDKPSKRVLKSLRQLAMPGEQGQTMGAGEYVQKSEVDSGDRVFGKGLRFDLNFGAAGVAVPGETLGQESPPEVEENVNGNDEVSEPESTFSWQRTPQVVDHGQEMNARTESTVGNSN